MFTTAMILKTAGAVLAFAGGIWIGLGLPGLDIKHTGRRGRPINRLDRTWLNRIFFGAPKAPRRFDTDRLIVPGPREKASHAAGPAGREREEPGD